MSSGNLSCNKGTEKRRIMLFILTFNKMTPKKVKKHLMHDFYSTKTGMHRYIHKPDTQRHR